MEEIAHRILDWALTGDQAFSNGDALAVIQIIVLLYAFRDRFFRGVSLQNIDAQIQGINREVSDLADGLRYLRGVIDGRKSGPTSGTKGVLGLGGGNSE